MSSEFAKSVHSINFARYSDKKFTNTWDDWHLVPSSRPVINPPGLKKKYIDLPGANGHLDYTEALTGYPLFENREGSLEFYVMNGYQEWIELHSKISNFMHGRKMIMILDDDPEWEYQGRFTINNWKSDKDYSKITIDYNVMPYKMASLSSYDEWLWNPFCFETDYIPQLKNIRVDGKLNYLIVNEVMPAVPIFKTTLDDSTKPILFTKTELPVLMTDYSYTQEQIDKYSESIYSGVWTVWDAKGIELGDTVLFKVLNTTTDTYNYIKAFVTLVQDNRVKATSDCCYDNEAAAGIATTKLQNGNIMSPAIVFKEGDSTVFFEGHGYVTIIFNRGKL